MVSRHIKASSFLFGVFAIALLSEAPLAQESPALPDDILPKVGAVFDVDREIFGLADNTVFTVIATGPDFVIYHEGELNQKKKIDTQALSVDFSGIYPESCMDKMPDTENRAKLTSLWPLSVGKSTDFQSQRSKGTYRITSSGILTHKNRKIPVYWIEGRLKESGFKTTVSIAVHPRKAMALSARWGDIMVVYRYEAATDENVSSQTIDNTYTLLSGIDVNDLGKCKKLFE